MKRPDSIIATVSLVAIAVWIFVALPIMYLPVGKLDTFLSLGITVTVHSTRPSTDSASLSG